MRTRWIFAGLLVALAVTALYISGDPEMASRYAQAQRDAALSVEAKDLVMGGLVVVIGGYLAWFLLFRRS